MRSYSPILDRALGLAASAHRTQERKSSGVPYIAHPAHVAVILIKHGFPEDAVVAGVLHDIVEDTGVTLAEVEAQFGSAVASLVDQVSEQKLQGGTKLPWLLRKQELLSRLSHAAPLAVAVKSADALHNCQTLLADLRTQGESVWRHFRSSPDEQLWFFQTLAAVLRGGLGGHPLSNELDEAVAQLAQWHREHSAPAPT
jgi:(p)ppGpp synthase/HD superfamily hydrolase